MSFFSVILPTYNRAEFLPRTIESAMCQTYPDWELIIVDDGSTDNTKEVVVDFQKKDNRIKYYHQVNAERSAARNNGIINASGKYMSFLDSDDIYLPDHLQVLYSSIHAEGFVKGLWFTNTQKGKTQEIGQNPVEYFLMNPVSTSRVCVEASLLEDFLFDTRYSYFEDVTLWMRIAVGHPVFQVPYETVQVTIHDVNSTALENNPYKRTLEVLAHFLNEHVEVRKMISRKALNSSISNLNFGIFKYYYSTGKNVKALYYLIKSLLNDPRHPQSRFRSNLLLRYLLNKNLDKLLGWKKR